MSNAAVLTGFLRELADLIGPTGAFALARVYGGRSVYVPEAIADDHGLFHLLGREASDKLSEYYAGDRINVPLGPYSRHGTIKRAVADHLKAGNMSAAQIAKALDCSERWVWEVKAELKSSQDPNQMSLFMDNDAGDEPEAA
ncbi:MAG: hypothetical protein AAGJ85_07555 [Pseudomonadota bacterium]